MANTTEQMIIEARRAGAGAGAGVEVTVTTRPKGEGEIVLLPGVREAKRT